MNQVWVFFKLIEVALGCLCMFFHIEGSLYKKEPLPHVLIFCATFLSFSLMAALGAFRLMITRSIVLSTELLLTLSAVIFHYFCCLLIMVAAIKDPHLAGFDNSFDLMKHPHFAHCKAQSIASLITGTMYLMHMFHVFDILLRMEPGDWRRQAVGRKNSKEMPAAGGRAGLYVLSKPVDNLLCRYCRCYSRLAYSQAIVFTATEKEEASTVERLIQFLKNLRGKFTVTAIESDESYLSTPTITTSDSDEFRELVVDEEESRGQRRRAAAKWRGASDSTSLWDQIEDRSTFNRTRSSQSLDDSNRPSLLLDRKRRSNSVWDDTTNREKSEILLVEQNSRIMNNSQEEPRKSRDSSVRFQNDDDAEEGEREVQSSPRTSASKYQEGEKEEK